MDELTPSDSISQSGSREDKQFYGAPWYPGPAPVYYQQPSPYPQAQQYYYQSYGAQVHAQGHPAYLPYNPTPQPMTSPPYPHSASRSHHRHHHKGRSRSRRSSSSTLPSGLASLYAPTLSYSRSGSSTRVPVAPNAPYSAPGPYASGTRLYALAAPYDVQQPHMLHVSQTTYAYVHAHPPASAASPYATHSAATSPNTSPYAMDTRALSSHSHPSSLAHSPRSSHSHSYSHRSSRSHSYQLPPVSPTPSNQPLVVRPNHDESVVVPLASGGCVVFPAQGHSMYINPSQQYPQETERRKPSFFGGLTGFVGRRSKRSRRDSY